MMKLFLGVQIKKYFQVFDDSLLSHCKLFRILKNYLRAESLLNCYNYYGGFSKIFSIGLGYKNFLLDDKLYILIGDCNYLIFDIPDSVKVICRKNQIYFLVADYKISYGFVALLQQIKRVNLYKGKGLIHFKNFKFLKLKIGKKQRFV